MALDNIVFSSGDNQNLMLKTDTTMTGAVAHILSESNTEPGRMEVNIPGGGYPPVGDVDSGVVFGPSGQYIGTLVQPVEADVKLGVDYGADGTEFEGTYEAGGGGNTYSRGRIVNA